MLYLQRFHALFAAFLASIRTVFGRFSPRFWPLFTHFVASAGRVHTSNSFKHQK